MFKLLSGLLVVVSVLPAAAADVKHRVTVISTVPAWEGLNWRGVPTNLGEYVVISLYSQAGDAPIPIGTIRKGNTGMNYFVAPEAKIQSFAGHCYVGLLAEAYDKNGERIQAKTFSGEIYTEPSNGVWWTSVKVPLP
jgi:hypothetical protein